MPFTLSHPAAVVPLAKRGLPLSALVIGSMAPDFLYFVPYPIDKLFAHTLNGVFLFCLPVGFAVLWLFHAVLKWPLLSLMPRGHQQRLAPYAKQFRFGPPRQWGRIAFALLLGILTHLLWDSFTHDTGWAIQHITWLSRPVTILPGIRFGIYRILQHGSSALGLLLLFYWYIRWYQHTTLQPLSLPVSFKESTKYIVIIVMLVTAGLLASLSGLARLMPEFDVNGDIIGPEISGLLGVRAFARASVVTGLGVMWLELLIFSIVWHLRARPQKQK